jgi:hypothetical protein
MLGRFAFCDRLAQHGRRRMRIQKMHIFFPQGQNGAPTMIVFEGVEVVTGQKPAIMIGVLSSTFAEHSIEVSFAGDIVMDIGEGRRDG